MMRIANNRGFSLIEVMIVVAIIGIIAAFAYPSYQEYTDRTRRADAQGALMGLANAMERHFTANNTYLGAGTVSGNTGAPTIYPTEAPLNGSDKYYDLTIKSATATEYTLEAIPKNVQAGDGVLQLTSTGIRSWDKNSDTNITAAEQTWEE